MRASARRESRRHRAIPRRRIVVVLVHLSVRARHFLQHTASATTRDISRRTTDCPILAVVCEHQEVRQPRQRLSLLSELSNPRPAFKEALPCRPWPASITRFPTICTAERSRPQGGGNAHQLGDDEATDQHPCRGDGPAADGEPAERGGKQGRRRAPEVGDDETAVAKAIGRQAAAGGIQPAARIMFRAMTSCWIWLVPS